MTYTIVFIPAHGVDRCRGELPDPSELVNGLQARCGCGRLWQIDRWADRPGWWICKDSAANNIVPQGWGT